MPAIIFLLLWSLMRATLPFIFLVWCNIFHGVSFSKVTIAVLIGQGTVIRLLVMLATLLLAPDIKRTELSSSPHLIRCIFRVIGRGSLYYSPVVFVGMNKSA